ncbi:hypothetical protein AB0K60_01420 [Thermopolyspora sp. NPDC052614]|uniref:hypothetical protein n=1 Tax=Thermopolyspora sp. NPDC052614 TaxID=3155682 RepID=UPI003433F5C1
MQWIQPDESDFLGGLPKRRPRPHELPVPAVHGGGATRTIDARRAREHGHGRDPVRRLPGPYELPVPAIHSGGATRTIDARRAREHGHGRDPVRRPPSPRPMIIPVTVNASLDAEDTANAMRPRGFGTARRADLEAETGLRPDQ